MGIPEDSRGSEGGQDISCACHGRKGPYPFTVRIGMCNVSCRFISVWTLRPQLVLPFGKVVELLRLKVSQEEASSFLSVLLPDWDCNVSGCLPLLSCFLGCERPSPLEL